MYESWSFSLLEFAPRRRVAGQNLPATGNAMQTKINCSDYLRACRRHQAANFFGSGELGTSPFFEQLSVRPINPTVRRRIAFPGE
jgi:hypothetical protein